MNPAWQARIEEQQRAVIADFIRRMAEAQPHKSDLEIAQAWGVDLRQLEWARKRTPLQRLRQMQAMAQFIVTARESKKRQEEGAKDDREAGLREPAASSG